MKKFVMLLIYSSLFGCHKEQIIESKIIDLSSCFSPELGVVESEQIFYEFLVGGLIFDQNSNLKYTIIEGSKTVFVLRHIYENKHNVIDDEYEERILFQIDENMASINISTQEEFADANCTFGFCGNAFPSDAFQTISGSIKGTKISDFEWSIEADLSIEKFNGGIQAIDFNAVFEKID